MAAVDAVGLRDALVLDVVGLLEVRDVAVMALPVHRRVEEPPRATAHTPLAAYGDEKVANRDIRVWHFVIENGY